MPYRMPTLNLSVLFFPGFDSCLDQPNRRIRTRMYGGVGGTPCEGRSYPYWLEKQGVENLPL